MQDDQIQELKAKFFTDNRFSDGQLRKARMQQIRNQGLDFKLYLDSLSADDANKACQNAIDKMGELRFNLATEGLALDCPGLEIAPLYRPILLKQQYNVFYTDCRSATESRKTHAHYEHDEIVDIDFVWTPGKRLVHCIPDNKRFEWAIASHVFEHISDPIGWLREIFEVLKPGAVISLALPHKRFSFDAFRRETDVAELIDLWIRRQSIPGPRQIFDFLSRSVDGTGVGGYLPFETAERFEDAARYYTDEQALEFVIHSWCTGQYLDIHCSVFTPESFVEIFTKLNKLGILNIEVSTPRINPITFDEFFVKLTKIGEPRIAHPGLPHSMAINLSSDQLRALNKEGLRFNLIGHLKHLIKKLWHTMKS